MQIKKASAFAVQLFAAAALVIGAMAVHYSYREAGVRPNLPGGVERSYMVYPAPDTAFNRQVDQWLLEQGQVQEKMALQDDGRVETTAAR